MTTTLGPFFLCVCPFSTISVVCGRENSTHKSGQKNKIVKKKEKCILKIQACAICVDKAVPALSWQKRCVIKPRRPVHLGKIQFLSIPGQLYWWSLGLPCAYLGQMCILLAGFFEGSFFPPKINGTMKFPSMSDSIPFYLFYNLPWQSCGEH